jgi:hypothetical protein
MNVADVKLGEYADPEQSCYEKVTAFLQEVERASLPDIVGATSGAWAGCYGAVHRLIEEKRVVIDTAMSPWEYVWRAA